MSSYNLERGQELYFIELNKLATSNSDLAEDILKLGALFGINVGVMQEKSHSITFNFDDETCMLSYDWTPSYKKLSSAVYHVANLNASAEEKISFRQMIEQVMEYYPKHISFNQATKAKTQNEILEDSSYKEILSNSEEVFNLTEADDLDGIAYDDIDLLEDLAEYLDEDDEAFTDEGKRALGLIDSDYDSTNSTLYNEDGEPVRKIKKEYKTGEVIVDENGDYVIKCPYTGSSDVYQISTNLFASYETDQPFQVKLSLADTAQ
jgi:hypothetical protein